MATSSDTELARHLSYPVYSSNVIHDETVEPRAEYRGMGMTLLALTLYNSGPGLLFKPITVPGTCIRFTPHEVMRTRPDKLGTTANLMPFYEMCKHCDLDTLLSYLEVQLSQHESPLESLWMWQYTMLLYKRLTGTHSFRCMCFCHLYQNVDKILNSHILNYQF